MWCKMLFVALALVSMVKCQENLSRGVQLRLTEKGMFYAVDVGIKIMQDDLKGKVINEKGKSGNIQYNLKNLRINKVVFANYKLTPVPGVGMRGIVSGIALNANGDIWYKYKKGWFPSISDTIGISIKATNIHFDLTLDVGADKTGHPTIDIKSCKAGVSDIDLDFHGGASWIYNLFSGIIENKLKDKFGDLLCKVAIEEINTKAKSELATFPVVKKLDRWAEIDYRLTNKPQFTQQYMDAYLKGEFKSSKNPVESALRIPDFTSDADHTKMLYFWLTDYTFNTAGEVYHKGGRLVQSFAAWDSKLPSELTNMLSTSKFALIFPKMAVEYSARPMSVMLTSFKAPKVQITKGELTLMLYANAQFQVKDKNNKIQDAFTIQFDITTSISLNVRQDNIAGKIVKFDYDATVTKTNVGKNILSLDSKFIKLILDHTVISKANPMLEKGFPLPKVDEVTLKNFEIEMKENVIRVGSDLQYKKKK